MAHRPSEVKYMLPVGLMAVNGAASKIKKLAGVSASELHFVFNFDRTLTVPSGDTSEDITTWHILKKHLPAEGQIRYNALFNIYRPMEIAGKMQLADAEAWWSQILDLFVEYKIDMSEVESEFLTKVSMRAGTAEIFDFAKAHGIPTVILSAGVKDIIELWSRTYGISPSIIMATDLILDGDKNVSGWDKKTLVHVLNKKERRHSELSRLRSTRPFAVLVGDGISDADMAEGEDTVLRVLMHNSRSDENPQTRLPEQFDIVCTTGSFAPLAQLLKSIVDN